MGLLTNYIGYPTSPVGFHSHGQAALAQTYPNMACALNAILIAHYIAPLVSFKPSEYQFVK